MATLDTLKRTLESINAKKRKFENEGDVEGLATLFEKYKDISPETLKNIVTDVKAIIAPTEEIKPEETTEFSTETDNRTDVKSAKGKLVKEPHKTQVNELDASEGDTTEETPEDFYTEDDDENADIDDELIISEEDENIEDKPTEEVEVTDEVETEETPEETEEDTFESYDDDLEEDELDTVEDEEPEHLDEAAEKIDTDIPTDDNAVDAADKGAKEIVNEDNTGAKAAMTNNYDGKGTFSSDVDALTDYINKL